jgi:hypothetical protein
MSEPHLRNPQSPQKSVPRAVSQVSRISRTGGFAEKRQDLRPFSRMFVSAVDLFERTT